MRKKILLFGPISNFGGREIETGFIASVFMSKFDVEICTTESISNKSQVYDFNKNIKIHSIKGLMYKKYFIIRALCFMSFFKNLFRENISHYANNYLAKRFFNYENKTKIILEEILPKYDVVFICAQLSSALISDVVRIAKKSNKKIIFRTTGTIENIDYDFIESIDCFIHHSQENANRIEKFIKHKYTIIDQCAFNEHELLKLPFSKNDKNNFLVLARLSPEKGVEELINFFLMASSENDFLYIAGSGVLENYLKDKYGESQRLNFLGFVDSTKISDLFANNDYIIIPSFQESGPLVGIEAMAAGKLIISTKVGAMSERLNETLNNFWFDIDDYNSFKILFDKLKVIDSSTKELISKSLKEKYIKSYSIETISMEYINLIDKITE